MPSLPQQGWPDFGQIKDKIYTHHHILQTEARAF